MQNEESRDAGKFIRTDEAAPTRAVWRAGSTVPENIPVESENARREPTSLEAYNAAQQAGETIGHQWNRLKSEPRIEIDPTIEGKLATVRKPTSVEESEFEFAEVTGFDPERINRAAFDALPVHTLGIPTDLVVGQRWRKRYDERRWLLAEVVDNSEVRSTQPPRAFGIRWTSAIIVDTLDQTIGGPIRTEQPDALSALRAEGWSVAVHNDYRINGESHTFWLFTHDNGRWVKGEARTDREALDIALAHARKVSAEIES